MSYGTAAVDVVQSSTTGTPTQFQDGSGTQIGTLCRAWVKFTGATGVVGASFNVSSVTRNAAGDYTVNFSTAMPDIYYTTNINGGSNSGGSWYAYSVPNAQSSSPYYQAPTTSNFRFVTSTSSTGGSNGDPLYVSVSVFR